MAKERFLRDEAELQKIFSNELWQMIMEHVEEKEVYFNICKASPHLRKLLHFRATAILFPSVIKPILERHTGGNRLSWLSTRKVCRLWKRGLDQLLQTQQCFNLDKNEHMHEMEGIIVDDQPLVVECPVFSKPQNFADFEEQFDNTHLATQENPIMKRKIELCIGDSEFSGKYYTACRQFLDKYGRHILYCIISLDFYESRKLAYFYNRRLQKILGRMPSLRALQIRGKHHSDSLSIIAPLAFPTLPDLEYLAPGLLPLSVVDELVESNPQVQNVVSDLDSKIMVSFYLEGLPDLRGLYCNISNRHQAKALSDARFTSRVKSLWLHLRNYSGLSYVRMFEILQRQFARSLVELHLSLPPRETAATTRLELPHLKILHLEMVAPQRLQLLLFLRHTLEELYLSVDEMPNFQTNCMFESDGNYELDLYQFWNEPLKSNIWSIFPNLQMLQTKTFNKNKFTSCFSCTRRAWNRAEILKDLALSPFEILVRNLRREAEDILM